MARGRKVNSNGERSKQLLLEKALELFSTYGYHETKISDIVKAANLTQPTFYLYFKSKDKLFMDLNEEFKENLLSILKESIEKLKQGNSNAREFIYESITHAFTYFYENPNLTKIGFFESQGALELKDQIAQIVTSTLHNEEDSLNLHQNIKIETLADSILGSVERLTLKYILTKEQEPEKLANDIVNIYFSESRESVSA